jgi:hypothetical protein
VASAVDPSSAALFAMCRTLSKRASGADIASAGLVFSQIARRSSTNLRSVSFVMVEIGGDIFEVPTDMTVCFRLFNCFFSGSLLALVAAI